MKNGCNVLDGKLIDNCGRKQLKQTYFKHGRKKQFKITVKLYIYIQTKAIEKNQC